MTAEEHLNEVKKLASARVKAARVAAEHEGLVLVDGKYLERLEKLRAAVVTAFSDPVAQMTRDYKDVQDEYPEQEGYNGKRFLIRRDEGREVFQALSNLKDTKKAPTGCLVNE